jgi:hypothetical protein
MNGKRKRKQRRKDAPKLRDRLAYDQRIWVDAVCDLRCQLADHYRNSKPAKLRFQDGRLTDNLWERVKAVRL